MIVLGVRRSGTTLLRVMLDRNPALAVPDESYFVPQLARRHRGTVEPASFVDDLRRLPTLAEWGLVARRGRSASSARDDDRRGDRGRLRGVRGRARQAPLGRQDAALHAAPAAPRAPVPRGVVRPPDPGRARRRPLVPLRPGRDHDRGLGLPPRRGGLRLPVGDRGAGGPRAGWTRGAWAVPGAALRGAGRGPGRRASPHLLVRRARVRRGDARLRRSRPSRPGRSTSSG